MTDYLTEREAWYWLAAHLEALGMPWDWGGRRYDGLCCAISVMLGERLIDGYVYHSMELKILRARRWGSMYLERPYAAEPRIKWCLKFAEECE